MDIFSFNEDENRQFLDDTLRFNHITEKQINPGFISVEGLLLDPIRGVDRGLNKLAFAVGAPATELLTPLAKKIDGYTGTDIQGYLDKQLDIVRKTIDAQAPDASVTTTTGQILNGLGDVMSRAAGGALIAGPAGAATLAGGTEAIFANDEGLRKKLDPATAAGKAILEGGSLGVGVMVPAAPFAKSLLTRLASGALSNTAIGLAQRGATSAYLEERGYKDMAQQYKAWDATAVMADVVLGAAFGGLAHASIPATPERVDAALTARNAQYFREDTAPGIPVDIPSNIAHQRALETATEQMNRGEPVDVSSVDGLYDANFIARERANQPENPVFTPEPVKEVETTYKPTNEPGLAEITDTDPILRDIANADQVLAKRGDIAVNIEDENGNNIQRSAAEMLREDDAYVSRAEGEAKGFMAAIECELRHGNQ